MDRDSIQLRLKWWQTWRYIAAIAFLIFALGFGAFVLTTVFTRDDVQSQREILHELEDIARSAGAQADANNNVLNRLDRNQAGIDELVAFVRDIQAESQQEEGDNTQMFVDLLCASSDPVRQAACEQLRGG